MTLYGLLIIQGLEDNEGAVNDKSEPPLKRSCWEQQENKFSSTTGISHAVLAPKNGKIAPKFFRQRGMASSQSSLLDQKKVTISDSFHELFAEKRKCTTSSDMSVKNVKSTSVTTSSMGHSKKPMGEPCSIHM